MRAMGKKKKTKKTRKGSPKDNTARRGAGKMPCGASCVHSLHKTGKNVCSIAVVFV
jgi:hypothetical protein